MADRQYENRLDIKKLLYSLFSMFVCLVLLFCAAFSWFSRNTGAGLSGAALDLTKSANFRISKTSGGADISTLVAPDNLFSVDIDDAVTEVYPGASGNFVLYASNLEQGATGGTLKFRPEIIAGGYCSGVYDAGHRENYVGQDVSDALDFLQGHVFVFKNLTSGVYSGWVNPYDGADITFQNDQQITLYWIWIDYYYKLNELDGIISDTDIQTIHSYYLIDNDPLAPSDTAYSHLLDRRVANASVELTPTRISRFYDFADEVIGRKISRFSFRIFFSNP